jgi:riboflavin synthase
MFTGLVETTGRVERVDRRQDEVRVRVEAGFATELQRGESVAIDGVCLTALERGTTWFEAVVSPETLSRTTLGLRSPGERVNLERALLPGRRLGGHLVQGHVDGVGVVESVKPEGSGRRVGIRFPDELGDFIVMKGSIAVDGVSLTVAARQDRRFEVALIPETLEITRLGDYAPGTPVNLEVDMMGRYVVEYLRGRLAGDRPGPAVTREHLVRHGFARKEGAR